MPTVFFLSDYGTTDEFVGVVHAVLVAAAPGVTVVDLTHHVPAFDVRAGARALGRAAPHLGPGVVLAVVDPGVGSTRRGLCLEVAPSRNGPRFFVGPDNGLLVPAAELVAGGSITAAVDLDHDHGHGADRRAGTFDGRDLFAPAAAALLRGTRPEELGRVIDPASVVRLDERAVEHGQRGDGRHFVGADVIWVDHFGNLQLSATAPEGRAAGVLSAGTVELESAGVRPTAVRVVATFSDLAPGELGLLIDANNHLAVVAGEASAARVLSIGVSDEVVLSW
jgi:S-adenosylmethionine hydrolase